MKIDNCEKFVREWSAYFNIKPPKIVYERGFDSSAKLDLADYKIVLNISKIKSEVRLRDILLHELAHCYLDSKKKPKNKTRDWHERNAEKLVFKTVKEFYPTMLNNIIKHRLKLCNQDKLKRKS